MTDIKSVQLLWIKGGLFLLLGCLAAGLIVLRASSLTDVALLALAIWAFCRAYYFAFYVIEKYVDPSFRFSGLTSLAKYMIVGNVQEASSNSNETTSESAKGMPTGSRGGVVYWYSLRWFLLAMIANVLIPTLSSELNIWRFGGWWEDLLFAGWIGWLAAQVAIAVIASALLRVPLKHRLPISLALLLLLAFALVLGIRLQEGRWDGQFDGFLLIAALVTFHFGLACLLVYRWRQGWVLASPVVQDELNTDSRVLSEEQVSIGYLMALTAAIAAMIALLKFFSIDFSVVGESDFVVTMLVGCGIEVCIVSVSIFTLHLALSDDPRRFRVNVILAALSIIVLPYLLMTGVSQLSGPFPKPTPKEYCALYVFFLSYSGLLLGILLSCRKAGLRLLRIAARPSV